MHEYTFKKMETAEEIQGRAYVHSKAWQETYQGLIDKTYLDKMTFEKCLSITHNPNNTIIAKYNDKVVGFVGYGIYRDEEIQDCAEIYGIYVLKEHYGKKVGYQLMNAALKELSHCGKVVLWVLKGNDRAIRFYERYGFIFDGTEKAVTLGTPNTELRMTYQTNGNI